MVERFGVQVGRNHVVLEIAVNVLVGFFRGVEILGPHHAENRGQATIKLFSFFQCFSQDIDGFLCLLFINNERRRHAVGGVARLRGEQTVALRIFQKFLDIDSGVETDQKTLAADVGAELGETAAQAAMVLASIWGLRPVTII